MFRKLSQDFRENLAYHLEKLGNMHLQSVLVQIPPGLANLLKKFDENSIRPAIFANFHNYEKFMYFIRPI